jgi:hypothetical protein
MKLAASAGGTRTMASRSVCPHSVCSQSAKMALSVLFVLCCYRRPLMRFTAASCTGSGCAGAVPNTCGVLLHSGSPPMMLPLPDASFSICMHNKFRLLSIEHPIAAAHASSQSTQILQRGPGGTPLPQGRQRRARPRRRGACGWACAAQRGAPDWCGATALRQR